MLHFEYHQKSESILFQAKERYHLLLRAWLSDESVEARYYLLEYLQKHHGYRGILQNDITGKPVPLDIIGHGNLLYWSISHSHNYIAYSVSDTPTGIDIAEYNERNTSVLSAHQDDEYFLLWEKNWNNFYILWTSKEALIKAWGNTLDDIEDIQLIKIYEGATNIFWFHEKTYTIQQEQHGSLFLSVTH